MIAEAQSHGVLNPDERAVRARDGAAILFLIYCPLRIGNLGRLEIGRSLVRMEAGFVISFEPDETKSGAPMSPYKLSEHIAELTARRFGTRLSAHRFRSLAATTAAEAAPDQAKLIRPLLSHRSNKVADIHYNLANMAKAVASLM